MEPEIDLRHDTMIYDRLKWRVIPDHWPPNHLIQLQHLCHPHPACVFGGLPIDSQLLPSRNPQIYSIPTPFSGICLLTGNLRSLPLFTYSHWCSSYWPHLLYTYLTHSEHWEKNYYVIIFQRFIQPCQLCSGETKYLTYLTLFYDKSFNLSSDLCKCFLSVVGRWLCEGKKSGAQSPLKHRIAKPPHQADRGVKCFSLSSAVASSCL